VILPPTVGGSYLDPTYGTKIVRITNVGGSMHAYGDHSAMNLDGTRLFVARAALPQLYAFDPATDALRELGDLYAPGPTCDWEDASWSRLNPHILYCRTIVDRRLYAYDVVARTYTLLRDFAGVLAGNEVLRAMAVDASDATFSFRVVDVTSGLNTRVLAWVRASDAVFSHAYPASDELSQAHLDKGGRFVVTWLADRWEVWEPRTDGLQVVHATDTERGGNGHQATGHDLYVGEDGWQAGLLRRSLSDATHFTHIVSFFAADGITPNWTFTTHQSLNQADERWFVFETYSAPGATSVWDPWEQEILLVSVDGTAIRRLAHHHSFQGDKSQFPDDYWNEPRPSVSLDGRTVVFTSNFDGTQPGDSSRRDVFLLRLPTICP
jgi:hypothetical protein